MAGNFLRDLGVERPIILAPMAGGIGSPELVEDGHSGSGQGLPRNQASHHARSRACSYSLGAASASAPSPQVRLLHAPSEVDGGTERAEGAQKTAPLGRSHAPDPAVSGMSGNGGKSAEERPAGGRSSGPGNVACPHRRGGAFIEEGIDEQNARAGVDQPGSVPDPGEGDGHGKTFRCGV